MNDNSGLIKQLGLSLPSPEVWLDLDWVNKSACKLAIKRDDLIHPVISGNKWRKLSGVIPRYLQQNVQHLVSFGGGHSNHLHALAYCCYQLDIKLTAIVRGHYDGNLTPTLKDMLDWGVEIDYVDKKTYQLRDDPDFLTSLRKSYPQSKIIPEGGSQQDALSGMAELVGELSNTYDVILAPVASGATLAGLISAVDPRKTQVVGIAVLKGQGYLESLVDRFLPNAMRSTSPDSHWHIEHEYHLGGYAKRSDELNTFCQDFYAQTNIAIEPVYSGKLFYAAKQLLGNNVFKKNQRILLIHTGGLQGSRHEQKCKVG